VIIIVRKMILIFTVVCLQSFSNLSIIIVNFLSLLMLVTAGFTSAWVCPTKNKLDLVNELFILFVSYHLCLFTDFMPNVFVREYIGYSLVGFTCFSVILNLAQPTTENGQLAIRKCKKRWRKHKMQKYRDKRRQLRR
jgi:hypothetical protein